MHVLIASTSLFMLILFFKLVSRLSLVIHLHLLPKSYEVLIPYLKLGSEKRISNFIRSSDSTVKPHFCYIYLSFVLQGDPNKTPASARHKRGCNCKKSSCLKKYCECYQVFFVCISSCMPPISVLS